MSRRRVVNDGIVIIGLCAFTHDSAAALVADGALLGFVEEERLSGDKHTSAFPQAAVEWLLGEAGLGPADVRCVAYNFVGSRYMGAIAQTPGFLLRADTRRRALPRAGSFVRVAWRHRSRMRQLALQYPQARVRSFLHHESHGLYAFASSAYEEAAVLVVDSLGETQTTTIGHATRRSGSQATYRMLATIDDPASLGYAYGAVTEHLGWRRGDEEGTVMALAALGDPSRFRTLLTQAIVLTDGGFELDPRLLPLRVLSKAYERTSDAFVQSTCPPRLTDEPVEQVHADLAAALQERTEQVILHLAAMARRATKNGLLCLAGGVAANCVAVGRVVEAGLFDEVHVPPAPGDSGTAMGAAIAAHLEINGQLPTGVDGRCYLGPSFDDVDLATTPRPGLAARRLTDPVAELVSALVDGRIVGVFRGPVEAGPRALGNRSILASPLCGGIADRLNRSVKFREPFRPFAPVVPAERAQDYFTVPQPVPFMSVASGVTVRANQEVPVVVHTNGTARVQTVTRAQNPFLADVLGCFGAKTGVPVLINTSLNVKGKPICGTPDMALDCLVSSGLDALLLGDWWVTK